MALAHCTRHPPEKHVKTLMLRPPPPHPANQYTQSYHMRGKAMQQSIWSVCWIQHAWRLLVNQLPLYFKTRMGKRKSESASVQHSFKSIKNWGKDIHSQRQTTTRWSHSEYPGLSSLSLILEIHNNFKSHDPESSPDQCAELPRRPALRS